MSYLGQFSTFFDDLGTKMMLSKSLFFKMGLLWSIYAVIFSWYVYKFHWSRGKDLCLRRRRPRFKPRQEPKLFSFLFLLPGLSQNLTKTQLWKSRCTSIFQLNIKILTIRITKKWSELKKVTWKRVQLNFQLYSKLLISQLLNYQFSKIIPFLESTDKGESTCTFRNVQSCSIFLQFGKKDSPWNFC